MNVGYPRKWIHHGAIAACGLALVAGGEFYHRSIIPLRQQETEVLRNVEELMERAEGVRKTIAEIRALEKGADRVQGELDRLQDVLPAGSATVSMPAMAKEHFARSDIAVPLIRQNAIHNEPDIPGHERGYWSVALPIDGAGRNTSKILHAVADLDRDSSFARVLDFAIRPDPENPGGRVALLNYTGVAPANLSSVQGPVPAPASDPASPLAAPTWKTFHATPTVISTTMTLTGSTQAAPARYKVNSVTVGSGRTLTMAPHAAGAESYIELWVTGNFTTAGDGCIVQQPGVHVTYHIAGDVSVSGSSFNNQSNLAANNVIHVIPTAAGVEQKVTVAGSGTLVGVVNAPGAAFTVSGRASMSGAFIGRTMTISDDAKIHCDQALSRKFGGGGAFREGNMGDVAR